MAYDISLGQASQGAAPPDQTFDEFYARHAETIGIAMALACDDAQLTDKVYPAALIKTSQRWKYLAGHSNPVGWALHAGMDEADKTLRHQAPTTMNEATGGYVRGLGLEDAMATLPLNQRAALVTAYFLGWTDEHTAAGFETATATISTRRSRGLTFLAHHLRTTSAEIESILVAHLTTKGADQQLVAPAVPDVRRRGRRITVRNRISAGLLAIGFIAAGGALVSVTGGEEIIAGPTPVAGPTSSGDWLAPVSDGQGGFVALNTRGASRFVRSSDGQEWFEETRWNSRAVDLRTDVTAFVRTGDRYVAVIEAPPSIADFVAPYIATSTNLVDWSVRQIDVVVPEAVEGLRTRYEVIEVAAAGTQLLVVLDPTESLDYRFFGVRPNEVCAESSSPVALAAFLCDGSVIEVERPVASDTRRPRYFLGESGGAFVEKRLPFAVNPRTLVGFGEGFAALDWRTGDLWTSAHGQLWGPASTSETAGRFVLLAGSDQGAALVISPDITGWTSSVVDTNNETARGEIAINLDPAAVWTRPELGVGPAGWALFVTTSRPWERSDVTPGWAVDTGTWIVSRLPDSEVILVQSADGLNSYRYIADGDRVQLGTGDSVTLLRPGSDEVLVEVTQQQIDRSRQASLAGDGTKAQVFYSANGQSWQSVWQGPEDTWFGSLAVGDDEILLSGTRLTGGPISIPLDG